MLINPKELWKAKSAIRKIKMTYQYLPFCSILHPISIKLIISSQSFMTSILTLLKHTLRLIQIKKMKTKKAREKKMKMMAKVNK